MCLVALLLFLLLALCIPSTNSVCFHNATKSYLKCDAPEDFLSFSSNETLQEVLVSCNEPWIPTTNTNYDISLSHANILRFSAHHCGPQVVNLVRFLPATLRTLNLTNNNITSFPWQSAQFYNSLVDIRKNALHCGRCENKWITVGPWSPYGKSSTELVRGWDAQHIYSLPSKVLHDAEFNECPFTECREETVKLNVNDIDTHIGSKVDLHCLFTDLTEPLDTGRNPFAWLLSGADGSEVPSTSRRNYSVKGSKASLSIDPVDSGDLGFVACKCQQCHSLQFDIAQIRFPSNITAAIQEGDRESVLVVHGFPLEKVQMSVTRLTDNLTETHILSDMTTSFFSDTFLVKHEVGHSYYFLQYYTLYVQECSLCPHIHVDGHYVIEVCADAEQSNCIQVNSTFHNAKYAEKIERMSTSVKASTSGFLSLFSAVVFVLSVAFLTACFLAIRFKRRMKKAGWKIKQRRISRNTDRTDETSIRLDTLSTSASNYMIQHVPIIDSDQINLREKIGKGAFGEVFVADWPEKEIQVAVKMLHNVQMDAEMDKEAALLAQLEHENVVKMYGIWICDAQITLVLEMMTLGDLKNYLRNRTPFSNDYCQFPPALLETELINICTQICSGLCYIASQQIVHRDFAARNCLVTGDSDLKVCAAALRPPVTVKISDFGMSRRLFPNVDYYRMQDTKTALPVRWLPPECLTTGKFTHQSDVWSFGVTLSEIFSYGEMPYGNLSNSEVLTAVMSGMRPSIPSNCPSRIREIIEDCWNQDPISRITSEDCLMRLRAIQDVL